MATILKASGSDSRYETPRAVAFNFGDVTQKAEQYLQEVQQQAAKILEDAEEQAKQIREQAKIDGAADARVAAEEAMQARIQHQLQFLVPAIQEAVVEVNREKTAWLRRWETDAINISIAIAERVIRGQIAQRPEITLELVQEALQLASGLGNLVVRLHPNDHRALSGNLETIVQEMKKLTPTEVVADESIQPGGCRVDTEYGSIDQQIETQLERIRSELLPNA